MVFEIQFTGKGGMKILFLLGLLFCSTALAFTTTTQVRIHSGSQVRVVNVALATTEPERAKGLMWVKDLQDDQGMLFVYPQATLNQFWMKNTPTALDMLFISSDKKIVFIAKSAIPFSEEVIDPEMPSQYVLEVKAGFVEKQHITVGDTVEFQLPAISKK